jgi:hypothetical protein
MYWLFDIFLIAIFLFFVLFNSKRGFVKAVWGFAKCAVSVLLSLTLGKAFGFGVELFIRKIFTGTVYAEIEPMIGESNGYYNISELFDGHKGFSAVISRFGANSEALEMKFGEVTNGTQSTVYEMSEQIATPIADTVSTILGILLIFVVSMIVLTVLGKVIDLLAKLVDLLAKLPIVKTFNSVFGAVLGAISGFVYVWIICLVFGVFIEYRIAENTLDGLLLIVKDSYLFNFFCNFSPIDFINIGL